MLHVKTIPAGERGLTAKLREAKRLVEGAKRDPGFRRSVLEVVALVDQRDYAAEVSAVFAFIKRHVRYTRDPLGLEHFTNPVDMMRQIEREGQTFEDCDGTAILAAAMLETIGNPTRFVVGRIADQAVHIWTEARVGARWIPLEVTRPATGVGWDPKPDFDSVRKERLMSEHVAIYSGQRALEPVSQATFAGLGQDPPQVGPHLPPRMLRRHIFKQLTRRPDAREWPPRDWPHYGPELNGELSGWLSRAWKEIKRGWGKARKTLKPLLKQFGPMLLNVIPGVGPILSAGLQVAGAMTSQVKGIYDALPPDLQKILGPEIRGIIADAESQLSKGADAVRVQQQTQKRIGDIVTNAAAEERRRKNEQLEKQRQRLLKLSFTAGDWRKAFGALGYHDRTWCEMRLRWEITRAEKSIRDQLELHRNLPISQQVINSMEAARERGECYIAYATAAILHKQGAGPAPSVKRNTPWCQWAGPEFQRWFANGNFMRDAWEPNRMFNPNWEDDPRILTLPPENVDAFHAAVVRAFDAIEAEWFGHYKYGPGPRLARLPSANQHQARLQTKASAKFAELIEEHKKARPPSSGSGMAIAAAAAALVLLSKG